MTEHEIQRNLRVVAAILAVVGLLVVVEATQEWADVYLDGARPQVDEWFSAVVLLAMPAVAVAFRLVLRIERAHRSRVEITESRLASVLGTASEWIWAVDTTGRITGSNDAVEDLLGWRAEEIIGRSAMDLVAEDQRDEMLHQLSLPGTGPTEGWTKWLIKLRHKDGSLRHVLSTANPSVGAQGQRTGIIGACRDVTADVARQELERRQALVQHERRDRVQRLIDERRIEMHFQPIVRLDSGEMVGVEALARFPGGQGPAHWFHEAGLVGLDCDLELLAIREAVAQFSRIAPSAYLSVNVSPGTLTDPQFLVQLLEPGIPTERLVVELTEHVQIADYEAISSAIDRLRRLGIRLAVDDAGAGYASLRHILNLRPDIIKLDRTVANGIATDPAQRALAGAMVQFAEEIGAAIVAEGVEEGACAAVLQNLGIRCAQGYLFARPQPLPIDLRSVSV